MGHYDDAYEADAEKRQKTLKQKQKAALKSFEKFLDDARSAELPERLIERLEDIEIYLKYKTGN